MRFLKEYGTQITLLLVVASMVINVMTCSSDRRHERIVNENMKLKGENIQLHKNIEEKQNDVKMLNDSISSINHELNRTIFQKTLIKIKYDEEHKDVDNAGGVMSLDSLLSRLY